MIVKISQTASNIKQTFDIKSDDFYFYGELGSLSRFQTIKLSNKDTTIKGIYNLSKLVNYIPFRWVFGNANLTRVFHLYKDENIYGSIVFSKHGFMKNFYVIALDNGKIFHCYSRSIDSFNYVSIYEGTKQIALIETYLNTNDYKYVHKLYILDEYNQFADTLSFFVLYYANYHFTERFHMSKGSYYKKSWSFSKYNDKYSPNWRETNFPDENFFGKTNLFKGTESYPDEIQDSLYAPKQNKVKIVVLVIAIIVACLTIFLGLIQIVLNIQKDTEEYKTAYSYFVESNAFKELNVDETKIRFNQYSSYKYTSNDNSSASQTVEIGFSVNFKSFEVVCHKENDTWQVCNECTLFK